MSVKSLTVDVKPYTAPRSMTWYVTWEDVPDGWAVAVLNDMFFFPVRRTETWPNGTTFSIPDNILIDRGVDVEFLSNENVRFPCYASQREAVNFIYRKLRRALRGNDGE